MKNILFLIIGLSFFGLSAQSEKAVTREQGSFSSLKLFDRISAVLKPSNENKIIIKGKYADRVVVKNKNGKLKIRMQGGKSFSSHTTFLEIHYKNNLDLIDVNEGSEIKCTEEIKQTNLVLRAQEGGKIKMNLNVKKLDIRAVSGGRIEVSGKSTTQNVVVHSGGIYEGDQLQTEQTHVKATTGGSAYINAEDFVSASVKAGGNIKIYGDPKVTEKQTVLGGNIVSQ